MIEPATTLCPCCKGKMHRIGADVSEALDPVPAVQHLRVAFDRPFYSRY
ncbi:MAG: IS66 family transposase zinc-finger binding domain-containing protein [Methylocystis sp.]